jgi:hypothetical protein
MGTIILEDNLKPKTYKVWGLPRYMKTKVDSYLPIEIGAAIGLRQALAEQCEYIEVQGDGLWTRRFKTSDVYEHCRKKRSLWNYLPRPQTEYETIMANHELKMGTGLYVREK